MARCRPPRRRWPSAPPPVTGSAAAACCTRCCSICRTCRKPTAQSRRSAGWTGRARACTAAAAATLAAEALAILAHPDLAPAFAPGSRAEVPLTGVVGDAVVGGLVDRLAVLPDRVLVVDFKTNRVAPARPEDTPVMYLRQMAAYRAVLRGVFPGREVRCALVWTRAARVAMLPDELLDAHGAAGRREAGPRPVPLA